MVPVWLILNIGSSSIKFGVHRCDDGVAVAKGALEAITLAPVLKAEVLGNRISCAAPDDTRGTHALTLWLLREIENRLGPIDVRAAGHRVVHGGPDFGGPTLMTPDIMARLEEFCPMAPGHQPFNLDGIRAVGDHWQGVPQIACFDTAFHRTRPRLAKIYALPRAMADEGILRYGFHGLSYDHIATRLPDVLGEARATGRVIVAHLGSGASLCALQNGRSMDTTMGFSAIDGLMMGTRAGQIDPGVMLHLMRTRGMDAPRLEKLLGRQSGLLGVSGVSPDMRDLLASDAPEAAEAVALFIATVVKQIGALAAGLGGLDALVFTAGIGERAPQVRLRIMAALAWLGLDIDAPANAAGETILTRPGSRILAAMIPTDEEGVILRALAGGPDAWDQP